MALNEILGNSFSTYYLAQRSWKFSLKNGG
jgi:hypothetical protein